MTSTELLQSYDQNAQAFAAAARAIPAELFSVSPAAGEWSPAYVIHHMADAELQFGVRYVNALSEQNPPIVQFDETKFPTALHYEKRSVANSIAAFAAAHNLNYEILKNTAPEEWNRTSLHPEKGLVSLSALVKSCAGHIGEHVQQLQSLAK